MEWDEITAIATAITAVAAIAAVLAQGRWTRFTVKIQISRELERIFYHDESMIIRRREAALTLIAGQTVPAIDEVLTLLGFVRNAALPWRNR